MFTISELENLICEMCNSKLRNICIDNNNKLKTFVCNCNAVKYNIFDQYGNFEFKMCYEHFMVHIYYYLNTPAYQPNLDNLIKVYFYPISPFTIQSFLIMNLPSFKEKLQNKKINNYAKNYLLLK